MTALITPLTKFIAENGDVAYIGDLSGMYTYVEGYDETNGEVDYVLRVDFEAERNQYPVLAGTATVERLAELMTDLFAVVELYRRRVERGHVVPNLSATDVRDDKAKALRALGLDEQSPEVRALMEELALSLPQKVEERRKLAAEARASNAALGVIITDSDERVAIEDLDLDRHRAFYCTPGPDNRPDAHTYAVYFYRSDGEAIRVVHGRGGEGEAESFAHSLLYFLLAFREGGIGMDLRAVDVRDRFEEVEQAAGLPPLENDGKGGWHPIN